MAFVVAFAILAASVAAYALVSLKNARHRLALRDEALSSRMTELETLHATSRELATTLDPERIVEIVERECLKTLPVDGFFMGSCHRETHSLTPRAPAPLGEALAAWVLRDKRALLVEDAAAAPEGAFRPPFADAAAGSVLAVPLLVGERVVGIVSVHSGARGAFDDRHLSFLATIGQQAALALENAHRHASATRDALTGLLLPDELLRRLEDEYQRAKRYAGTFSLLMLGLDAFKELNDRLGHAAGDRYLRELGAAIKGRLRAADIGCRYGGDELCLLLPETDFASAGLLAERLRQTVARLVVDVDGTPVRTTASFGIASYPTHDAGTPRALLRTADHALHTAKRAGRNRVA